MSPDTSPPDDDNTADSTPPAVGVSDTVPHALQEGLALVLAAEDGGDWKAVADWLARNPQCAPDLAEFLAAQQGIKPALAPLRLKKPEAPRSAGGLELREVIGRGAMGVVHRAFDPSLKCEVAVKLVHTAGDLSPDELARFRFDAEAVAVASLGHTNEYIVPVLRYGEEDGVPYLVMPLMPGGSLAAWLKSLESKDRKLQPKQAAEIARDIALGVHHAHQRGLIHRDLKPGNILRDDRGRPRVADFGLARPVDATATRVAGTPAYMAPEQTRAGKGLTTAVDVWAVGVILFELLAGGPPFGGADVGSVLRKVAEEPAPPVRTFRPDVPRDLESIVTRCLEKRPDDRYPSALAAAADLQRFLDGEPVGGRRGRVEEFTRLFIRNRTDVPITNHLGHLIGGAATLVLQAGATAAAWAGRPHWAFAALAAEMALWAVLFALFIWSQAGRLNSAERASGVVKFWAIVALLCLIPSAAASADLMAVFPPATAVIGLCILVHGPIHGGREFLGGVAVLAAAAVMPVLPVWAWPLAHGLTWGGWAVWYSRQMRAHQQTVQADESRRDAHGRPAPH